MQDDDLIVHKLALGGTRPALMPYLGMPWIDFCVFVIAALECLLMRPQFLVVVIPAWAFSFTLYWRDYNAGRVFVCWLTTTPRSLIGAVFAGLFCLSPEARESARQEFMAPSVSPRPHSGFRGIYRA